MTRVHIVVEGQTEESFIKNVLAPALWPQQVYVTAIILGSPGHKGGNVNYARVRRDILTLLKQEETAYCSTMLDFYGLGQGSLACLCPQIYRTSIRLRASSKP